MTVYELIQKLSQYPADLKVVLAADWSEPQIDDGYIAIPAAPALALHSRDVLKRHVLAEVKS